jgi:hypothetical protein
MNQEHPQTINVVVTVTIQQKMHPETSDAPAALGSLPAVRYSKPCSWFRLSCWKVQ